VKRLVVSSRQALQEYMLLVMSHHFLSRLIWENIAHTLNEYLASLFHLDK
jgi:hypothetical protein